jgi:hypothetical protein
LLHRDRNVGVAGVQELQNEQHGQAFRAKPNSLNS